MTTLKINGVEIAGYVKIDGMEWETDALDGPNAGRSISGDMIRDFVALKDSLPLTCRELTGAERRTLKGLLFSAEFLTVTSDADDFPDGSKTMYCAKMTGGFARRKPNGVEMWKDIKFTLVEK